MKSYTTLINWVEDIKNKNNSSAASLFIIKNNECVLEYYSGRHSHTVDAREITKYSQFNVASARKSYLGLAVAYALYDGKIKSLDDYAVDYFTDYDKNLLGYTTIRHLVTHSHGLHQLEDGTIYREFEPGESWAYRGINIIMMTELINKLYGCSFPDLLQERVFKPLQFKETVWQTKEQEELVPVINESTLEEKVKIASSKDGTESNLHVSTREFAYWGNVHLNKGKVKGKQIIPQEVIDLATTQQSPEYPNPSLPQNGLFWYVQDTPAEQSEIGERVPKGSYQILGINGPTLLIIPAYNVVVAKMYNKRYNYGGENYLYYLREFSNLVADTFRG